MIEVKGYVCSHCKQKKTVSRVYASKKSCARHEVQCFKNPETQSCATCAKWAIGEHWDYRGDMTISRRCSEKHDEVDTGFCNGISYPPAPQTNCEYWENEKDGE